MTQIRITGIRRSWLRRALRLVAPVALMVCLAAPAFAARIVQVRVGNHPTYSRVVFELDAHAGYQIESRDTKDDKVLALTIDASSRDRDVVSKSLGVGAVKIESVDGKSVATVTLRRDDLTVKEMILSNPPRIVLDFRYPAEKSSKLASAGTDSTAKVQPAPPPAPAAKPAPSAEPVADMAEPEPVAQEPVVQEPVAPAPVPVVEKAPVVAEAPVVDEPVMAEPEPAMAAAEPVEDTSPEPAPIVDWEGSDQLAAADSHETEVFEDDESDGVPAEAADTYENEQPIEGLARQDGDSQQVAPTPAEPSTSDAGAKALGLLKSNWMPIAAAVGGLLLVALVVTMMRRRGSLPNDLDLTALDPDGDDLPAPTRRAESEPTEFVKSRIPEEGFEMSASTPEADASDLPKPAVPEPTAVMPVAGDSDGDVDPDATLYPTEANTAAYSLSEVSAQSAEPNLFDEDTEGEKQMDMESTDLPAQRGEFSATPAADSSMGGSADSELSSMVQELMTRLSTLETRLDESNEAREQLERQVAAQSEELRVQRAAIARTQRALRSLSRTDEDQATEPALRNPSA